MVSRAGPSSVQAKTATKAPKHTVAAPKRKKQILPVALIYQTKRSLPKAPVGAPRQGPIKYPKQPLIISSPGPQDPNQFLCLQPLLNANSVSVSQVFEPDPVEGVTGEIAKPLSLTKFASQKTISSLADSVREVSEPQP